jgi:hypothetical protein
MRLINLLGSSVARIPNTLFPAKWGEQVEIEGEGPLNVGDSQIDVMDSSRWHRSTQSIRTGVKPPELVQGSGKRSYVLTRPGNDGFGSS